MLSERVSVVKGGDLEREVWTFWVRDDLRVVLDGYASERRKTRRHKWRADPRETWSRIGRERIQLERAPEPPGVVVDEAVYILRDRVRYAKGER